MTKTGRGKWGVLLVLLLSVALGTLLYWHQPDPGETAPEAPAPEKTVPRETGLARDVTNRPAAVSPETPRPTEEPAGDGAVAGTVFDSGGGRVPGAMICVVLGNREGESQAERPSPNRGQEALKGDAFRRYGETDAKGDFLIANLPWGTHSIMAVKGKSYDTSGASLSPGLPAARLTLVLKRGGTIAGVVVNSGGDPVPDAVVDVFRHDGSRISIAERNLLSVKSGEDGRFVLELLHGLKWELQAQAAGYAALTSEPIPVDTADVTLVLRAGGSISGAVRAAETGRPLAGVPLAAARETSGRFPKSRAVSGEDGRFEFPALTPGIYWLSADDERLAPVNGPIRVEVADARAANLDVVLALGGIVRGQVRVLETGEGVGDFSVTARRMPNERVWQRSTRTDGSGGYEITGLPPGDYEIAPSNQIQRGLPRRQRSGGKTSVTLSLSAVVENVDLTLARGVAVAGTVLNKDGTPAPFASVYGLAQNYASNNSQSGPDGAFTLCGFAAGDMVHVRAQAGDWTSRKVGPLTLPAEGLTDVAIVLDIICDGGISGVVVDRHGRPCSAEVGALPLVEGFETVGSGSARTDWEGNFTLTRVRAGEYMLRVGRPNSSFEKRAIQQVRVPPGVTVTGLRLVWDPEEVLEISGTVFDTQGKPVSGAKITCMSSGATSGAPGALSQNDGTYVIKGLPPGEYLLLAQAQGFVIQGTEAVAAGSSGVDIILTGGPCVNGQVLDARTKAPVTDFEIGYRFGAGSGADGAPEASFSRVSNAQGRFSVTAHQGGGHSLSLVARARGYQTGELYLGPVRAGEIHDNVVLTLEPEEALVHGLVRSSTGGVVAGADVFVGADPRPGGAGQPAARTAEDGTFQISGLTQGLAALSAIHSEHGMGLAWVEVRPRETGPRVEIVLTPAGEIAGKVTKGGEPIAQVFVNLRREGARVETTQTDENGDYRFRQLVPGVVQVETYILKPATGGGGSPEILQNEAVVAGGQVTEVNFDFPGGGGSNTPGGP